MTILRYEVPVDDRWHKFSHTGEVVHVGSRQMGIVEFWTNDYVVIHTISDGVGNVIDETFEREPSRPRDFWYRVYGTGMDTDGGWVGTTYDGASNDLVWHLFERQSNPANP